MSTGQSTPRTRISASSPYRAFPPLWIQMTMSPLALGVALRWFCVVLNKDLTSATRFGVVQSILNAGEFATNPSLVKCRETRQIIRTPTLHPPRRVLLHNRCFAGAVATLKGGWAVFKGGLRYLDVFCGLFGRQASDCHHVAGTNRVPSKS